MASKREVAIVGAGISGLATAYRLSQTRCAGGPFAVTLLEAASRVGGILVTERLDGFLFEGGPDSFVVKKPQTEELCRELGLGEELIESRPDHRGAWLWWEGGLHRFPMGVFMKAPIPTSALLRGTLLSESGRRRLLEERLVAPSELEDESVADFVRRRLGGEVLQRLVEPLVAGVFGGEAASLSARFALPALYAHEKRHGHVTAELEPAGRSDQSSPFVSLRNGVGSLSAALRKALQGKAAVCLNSRVSQIRRRGGRFELVFEGGKEPLSVDAVVLATPSLEAVQLLGREWPDLAAALSTIGSAPAIVGCFGYRRDVTNGRAGTGVLIPPAASKRLLACTWVHQKFAHRCPDGGAQIRCFIGSGQASRLMAAPDTELIRIMEEDLADLLGIRDQAAAARIYRWRFGLPQYTVGHHARLETMLAPTGNGSGLYFVGNYLDGVGVSDCIRHAGRVAGELADAC